MEIPLGLWETAMTLLVCIFVAIVSFAVLNTGEFRKAKKTFWILFLVTVSILTFFGFNFFFPELFSKAKYLGQSNPAIIAYGWGSLISYFVFLFAIWIWLENKNDKEFKFPFGRFSETVGLVITIITAASIFFLCLETLNMRYQDEVAAQKTIFIQKDSLQ